MLCRVESNILFLAPCKSYVVEHSEGSSGTSKASSTSDSDSSLAWSMEQSSLFSAGAFVPVAQYTGESPRPANSLQFNIAPATEVENHSSLYYSEVGASFDGYYSTVLSCLLNIIVLESPSAVHPAPHSSSKRNHSAQTGTSLPSLPPRWTLLQNLDALSIATALLRSGKVSLVAIGVRLAYALMRSSAKNAVALEHAGVSGLLIQLMISLAAKSSPLLPSALDCQPHAIEAMGATPRSALTMLADVCAVLQLLSLAKAQSSESVLAAITTTLLYCFLNGDNPASSSSSSSSSTMSESIQQSRSRCQNCETEDAQLECLNDM
jgi:hypothetical protein